MNQVPEAELIKLANGLEGADRLVMKGLKESNWELFSEQVHHFNELKRKIKSILVEFPVITLHNAAARDTVRRISQDEPFPADKVASKIEVLCKGGSIDHQAVCALPDEEVDSLGHIFSPKLDNQEYVKNLYEIGCLILGIPVTRTLIAFVTAARDSYAFGNYLAVLSLCRTMLEIALRDMAERKHLIPRDPESEDHLSASIRRKITPPHLRDSIEGLYRKASLLIHGRTTTDKIEARDVFKRTLELIQGTYKHYGLE